MTSTDLCMAGFREFAPSSFDRWSKLHQLRVRDQNGTRYFINVYYWDYSKYNRTGILANDWESEVTYNDGAAVNPAQAALRILAYSIRDWSAMDVQKWANDLWTRLTPNYYEREQ